MNVLSLFDGMCCGRLALARANIKVDKYYSSEIDKFAIKEAQANFPDNILLGDVTKWREWDIKWESIDLLIGGSPCQGFSSAGSQLNFNDPRSKLFFEYIEILNHLKSVNPNIKFLLENVKMKKEWLDKITSYVGVEPVFINSNLVSAQNRQRYYWCNWNIEQPQDRHIYWNDVREHGVIGNSYYYTEKALQWLAQSSHKRRVKLAIWGDKEKAQCLEATMAKKYCKQRFFAIIDTPDDESAIAAMYGRKIDPLTLKRADWNKELKAIQQIECRYDNKSNALTTVSKDNVVVPFTLPNRIPVESFFFRYLTIVECCRLQTVPDDYFKVSSKSQAYKMLGNGWTVDVIAHIFSSLTISCPKINSL